MTTALTRRHLLTAALATGVAVPLGGRAWAAPGTPRLTLPAPTGPHRLGTVSLHLVDRSRPDPVAGPGRYRELMASVWYPAARDDKTSGGAVDARRAVACAARVRRLRPRCRGATAHRGPRGSAGAPDPPPTAGDRLLPRRRGPPFRGHHRGPGARQPRLRRGDGGPHVRRVRASSPMAGCPWTVTTCPSRRGTPPTTSSSFSTASRTSPPGATPTPGAVVCRPAWAPRSTRIASACSAGRRARPRPPS